MSAASPDLHPDKRQTNYLHYFPLITYRLTDYRITDDGALFIIIVVWVHCLLLVQHVTVCFKYRIIRFNKLISAENILRVQNIGNTFLILSCSLNSSGHGLQGVESVPQGCWPILTPMLPTVVSSWLNVLCVVDHSWYTWETVEGEKPSSIAVLDTLKPVHLAPATIPCSKALKSFVLPIHPRKGTHTQCPSIHEKQMYYLN